MYKKKAATKKTIKIKQNPSIPSRSELLAHNKLLKTDAKKNKMFDTFQNSAEQELEKANQSRFNTVREYPLPAELIPRADGRSYTQIYRFKQEEEGGVIDIVFEVKKQKLK